jgi:hypothetical protein
MITSLHRRLGRLEQQSRPTRAGPGIQDFVAEYLAAQRWLSANGYDTPEDALAAEADGPAGRLRVFLKQMIEARKDVEQWKRERFGALPPA